MEANLNPDTYFTKKKSDSNEFDGVYEAADSMIHYNRP